MHSFKSALLGGTVAILALAGTLSAGVGEAAAQQTVFEEQAYGPIEVECLPFDIACLLFRPTATIAGLGTAELDRDGTEREGLLGIEGPFNGEDDNNGGGGHHGGGHHGGGHHGGGHHGGGHHGGGHHGGGHHGGGDHAGGHHGGGHHGGGQYGGGHHGGPGGNSQQADSGPDGDSQDGDSAL